MDAPLRIRQIVPSLNDLCGIAYFAQAMQGQLQGAGALVETSDGTGGGKRADVIVLHHHSEVISDSAVAELCARADAPVILFPHADDARHLYPMVAGVVAMAADLVRDAGCPGHFFPHPAWVPEALSGRPVLRRKLGLPPDQYIIGSNGFLKFEREFDRVVHHVLERTEGLGVCLYLVLSPWRLASPGLLERLEAYAAAHPARLILSYRRLETPELNIRLQACDLLWCWTNAESSAYASGVAADQYASGTRIVVADKRQHSGILGLPNVVPVSGGVEALCDQLLEEASARNAQRHDPLPVSWRGVAPGVLRFLQGVADGSWKYRST